MTRRFHESPIERHACHQPFKPMNATLEIPEAATMEAVATPAPSKIESLRAAVERALRLEAQKSTASATAATVAALRAQIEGSTDEGAVVKLMKALNDAETSAKIESIRSKKLEADISAAWQAASELVRHAVNEVADVVGTACEGAYDHFREICVKLMSPEIIALADGAPSVAFRVNSGLDRVASGALSVGPANMHQASLQEARARDHYQTACQYCEGALRVMDAALADVPNIKAQAAKLSEVHAAVFKITA